MISYSENKAPWELHQELDRYLAKLPKVSCACRLSRQEEMHALRLCAQATPLIKNRLEFLVSAGRGDTAAR